MCLNEGMFKGAKVVACREDSPTRNDRGRRLTLKLQEKDGKRNEKCTENELCIWARGGGDPDSAVRREYSINQMLFS